MWAVKISGIYKDAEGAFNSDTRGGCDEKLS